MMDDVLFSRNSDNWETPLWLLERLRKEHGEMYDPCPINYNVDGLSTPWRCVNFVNPPYSKWQVWMEKAYIEMQLGRKTILLLPARTDTKAFHKFVWNKMFNKPYPWASVEFLEGRLKFSNSKNSAPFPSMIIVFTPIMVTGNMTYSD